ncbi:hypothetical protein HYV84_02375 [Candidatus Woesearchaeota archaeon]|nr:hypothetical protein [Candidatus Woesearchaeota archaeon]
MDFDDDNEEEGDDLQLDMSKIKDFFSKKKKKEPIPAKPQNPPVEPIQPSPLTPSQAKAEPVPSKDLTPSTQSQLHSGSASAKPQHTESQQQPPESEEEISIDLTKIKGLFKGMGKRFRGQGKEIIKGKGQQDKKNRRDEPLEKGQKKDVGGQPRPGEDFAIDLTKIKGVFSRLKNKAPEETEKEDLGIDIRKSLSFFKNHKRKIVPLLFILLPIILSVILRIQPVNLPITDTWAEDAVFGGIKNNIRAQIDQQFPNLPEQNKAPIIESEFARLRNANKNALERQIQAQSQFFKSAFRDENGINYLQEIDPYYWLRLSRNVISRGHPGDELRELGGKLRPYDTFIAYPEGRPLPPDNFHAYLQAYLFKIVRFFNANIKLEVIALYIPVILSALAIIPAFFIGRRLLGNFAGLISAIVVAIHPAFLSRTVAGLSDTDPYTLLFPLLIGWLYIEALSASSWKKKAAYSGMAGLFLGIFSFAWGSGWWYALNIVIISQSLYLIFSLVKILVNRKDSRNHENKRNALSSFSILLMFLLAGAASASLFTSFQTFADGFISGPLSFLTLKAALKGGGAAAVWPNVFSTVEEQASESLKDTIARVAMGSNALFLLALVGVLFTFLPSADWGQKPNKTKLYFLGGSSLWYIIITAIAPKSPTLFVMAMLAPVAVFAVMALKQAQEASMGISLFIAVWFAATVFASAQGARFSSLSASSFGIVLAIGIGTLVSIGTKIAAPTIKLHPLIIRGAFAVIVILLFISPIRASIAAARNEVPFIDDAWYASLQKIDQSASPDAAITSWWDFGHWFKAIGNRPATFDGTSQNTPNAYYVGRMLLEKNETVAVSLLRMVNCGQNLAHDTINEKYNDTPKTLDLLYRIITHPKDEAASILRDEGFGPETVEKAISYTHCGPPESYFITSEDMVSKGFVWGHFGLWNFSKALIYQALQKEEYKNNLEKAAEFLQGRFHVSRKEAEDIFFEVDSFSGSTQAEGWIAPWPNYQGTLPCKEQRNNSIICTQGQATLLTLNLTTLETSGINTRQGIENPEEIILPKEDGSYARRRFPSTLSASIMMKPLGNGKYTAIVMDSPHADSLFSKLMFFDGHGLRYFEKFSDEQTISGGRIIIWKVNWDGNATNKLALWAPKQRLNSTVEINQAADQENAEP